MKLKSYRVQNFKSIFDSNDIKVDDQITCLVGKNEAGKTALLKALYLTNPLNDENFSLKRDYPKKYKPNDESYVVSCTYQLEEEDIKRIEKIFGTKVLAETTCTVTTFYESNGHFYFNAHDTEARIHLTNNKELSSELVMELQGADSWDQYKASLEKAEKTTVVSSLTDRVEKIIARKGVSGYIYDSLIQPYMPKFLYFDEYYQLTGIEKLEDLIERQENGSLKKSDYPLLGLIRMAGIDLEALRDIKNTDELLGDLERASNTLTAKAEKYWKQNQHIEFIFDKRAGSEGDPDDMQSGQIIFWRVKNKIHKATTAWKERSRGFIWFFSFLAWYENLKEEEKKNLILLLDEPGLSLHGKAQQDLCDYFEQELTNHQAIYSTHSPFMINPKRLDRVRIVQDKGIDAQKALPKEKDGTKVSEQIYSGNSDTLFPLQGALGYSLQSSLFIGPNTLIVEGVSDLTYIQTISGELERESGVSLDSRWTIVPVGGSGRVHIMAALLAPQKNMNIAVLLDKDASNGNQGGELIKSKILKVNRVFTYNSYINKEHADIEDLFDRDFYVQLVNEAYKKELKNNPIDIKKVNDKTPRIVKAIKEYCKKHALILSPTMQESSDFSHYRPARVLAENIAMLWKEISASTKERFGKIFKDLNGRLKID